MLLYLGLINCRCSDHLTDNMNPSYERSGRPVAIGSRSSFFCAPTANKKKAGFQNVIYAGGVSGGIQAGF